MSGVEPTTARSYRLGFGIMLDRLETAIDRNGCLLLVRHSAINRMSSSPNNYHFLIKVLAFSSASR